MILPRTRVSKNPLRTAPLAKPIKQLGEHKVPLRLHREVTVEIPGTSSA
jgi:ribosomal protein L9